MDENQNPEENEKSGTQLGRITPSERKKKVCEGLVEETARDALRKFGFVSDAWWI
jgi:hypothetical protein